MLTPLTKILKCLCVGRATGRQAHVDDYHRCKQRLKECDNNWISSQSQHFLGSVSEPICDYTSGWKGNHSHRWGCSSFTTPATVLVSWKPCDQIRGDFGSSQRRLKTLLCWNRLLGAYKDKRNKYQPATVFVALNIPPVRSDFPNLAMRAILEWTPGRAWRQSGKRELHSNDFKPLWKKMKIYRDLLSMRTLWGHHSDTKPSFTNTFKVWLWIHNEPIKLLYSVQKKKCTE